jgi:hypothetical protein
MDARYSGFPRTDTNIVYSGAFTGKITQPLGARSVLMALKHAFLVGAKSGVLVVPVLKAKGKVVHSYEE